jgi:hypothetical protein
MIVCYSKGQMSLIRLFYYNIKTYEKKKGIVRQVMPLNWICTEKLLYSAPLSRFG